MAHLGKWVFRGFRIFVQPTSQWWHRGLGQSSGRRQVRGRRTCRASRSCAEQSPHLLAGPLWRRPATKIVFKSRKERERTHRWEHWIGSEVRLIGHIALALAVVGVPAGPVLKKPAVTRKPVRLRLTSGKPPFINHIKCAPASGNRQRSPQRWFSPGPRRVGWWRSPPVACSSRSTDPSLSSVHTESLAKSWTLKQNGHTKFRFWWKFGYYEGIWGYLICEADPNEKSQKFSWELAWFWTTEIK